MRAPCSDVPPLELDRSGVGDIEAGHDVDEGRLPCPVRPDEAQYLATAKLDGDVLERAHSFERA